MSQQALKVGVLPKVCTCYLGEETDPRLVKSPFQVVVER